VSTEGATGEGVASVPAPTQSVTVQLFAVAAERAGARQVALEVAVDGGGLPTVGDVRRALAAQVPALAPLLAVCAFAVAAEYAEDAAPVPPGAEVAVIPPVSGGAATADGDSDPYGRIEEGAIDVADLMARVGGDAMGAVVVFYGTVRGESEGRRTVRLEYESHRALGEREMRRVLAEVMAAHAPARLAAAHRVGALAVGEVAVVVAAAAPHRDEAFAAARTAIDRIKAEVPIWKREVGPDGAAWVEGTPVAGAGQRRIDGSVPGR
jgi:molybdopterin synthase catalytic subunit/molybdopterin converting factor small subunit